jgi:hypothetical protein
MHNIPQGMPLSSVLCVFSLISSRVLRLLRRPSIVGVGGGGVGGGGGVAAAVFFSLCEILP